MCELEPYLMLTGDVNESQRSIKAPPNTFIVTTMPLARAQHTHTLLQQAYGAHELELEAEDNGFS